MGSLRHRIVAVLVLVSLWAGGIAVFDARAWDQDPRLAATPTKPAGYDCGANDLPESVDVDASGNQIPRPWIQGDVSKSDQDSGRAAKGYNCGLELVGYTPLNQFGRTNANANMYVTGHCAYVSGAGPANPLVPSFVAPAPAGGGVAVVDVSDPVHPEQVANLTSPGALSTSETIAARTVTLPDGTTRSILVVGQYGNNVVNPLGQPMDVYDVSDPNCASYKLLTTYLWPNNIHNLTISPDGKYVFATIPTQVADISGLWNYPEGDPNHAVKFVANIENLINGLPESPGPANDVLGENAQQAPTHPTNSGHEAFVSDDGNTLYVGAQTAEDEVFTIIDVGDWLYRGAAAPTVINQWSGRGHSIRLAHMDGSDYILHSEESPFGTAYSCVPKEANPFAGPAQPMLTRISDDRKQAGVPVELGLEINEFSNCPEQLAAKEDNSVHYHDVDDPTNTTFVMASMWNSGIRVFDVRHPDEPKEVAYFNPADIGGTLDHTWGHLHWDPVTHDIWFASAAGGFWVVHMEDQVYGDLGLEHGANGLAVAAAHRGPGFPGTAGVHVPKPAGGWVDITAAYCTLAQARRLYAPA